MSSGKNYITVHLEVRGAVQGVGFRYWTLTRAREYCLGGFVRNMPDGSVEALLSGPEESVEEMIRLLRIGPASALVKEIEILERRTVDHFTGGFTIAR